MTQQKGTNRAHLNKKQTPKDKFTPAQIIAALKASGGVSVAAARMLGCSPSTIANYLARNPEIAQAKKEIEAEHLDVAETVVIKRMTSPTHPSQQLRAAIFYLQTKGASRGYGRGRQTIHKSDPHPESKRVLDFSRLSAGEQETLKHLLEKATIRSTTPPPE